MAIRPKVGEQVELEIWEVKGGQAVPPKPWLATVVEVKPKSRYFHAAYVIKRAHDGALVRMVSRDLKRPRQWEGRG